MLMPEDRFNQLANQTSLVRAYNDPVIFRDERVFKTLLRKEAKYMPSSLAYCNANAVIQPAMRKEVADWMLDVCEHHSVQNSNPTSPPEVFCLAMNYMDRFLSICSIASSQLQLLGAVCLMVAWKVREHDPLPVQKLVEYSDSTLTLNDIMEWEVLLLSKLEWDVSAVIAFDFVEHIIQRLEKTVQLENLEGVRNCSEVLITMCSGYHSFSNMSPCLIATACVLTALRNGGEDTENPVSQSSLSDVSMSSLSSTGLEMKDSDFSKLFSLVEQITLLSKESIRECMDQISVVTKDTLSKTRKSPNPLQGEDHLVQPQGIVTSTPRSKM